MVLTNQHQNVIVIKLQVSHINELSFFTASTLAYIFVILQLSTSGYGFFVTHRMIALPIKTLISIY